MLRATLLALLLALSPYAIAKGGSHGGHSGGYTSNHVSHGNSGHAVGHVSHGGGGHHATTHTGHHSTSSHTTSHTSKHSGSHTTTHHSNHVTHDAHGIARDKHGHIARSAKAKDDFKKQHPCPATGKSSGACPGYVIDHVKPLKRGGADAPSNMQWQTKEAAKEKDRWE